MAVSVNSIFILIQLICDIFSKFRFTNVDKCKPFLPRSFAIMLELWMISTFNCFGCLLTLDRELMLFHHLFGLWGWKILLYIHVQFSGFPILVEEIHHELFRLFRLSVLQSFLTSTYTSKVVYHHVLAKHLRFV